MELNNEDLLIHFLRAIIAREPTLTITLTKEEIVNNHKVALVATTKDPQRDAVTLKGLNMEEATNFLQEQVMNAAMAAMDVNTMSRN